MPSNSPLSSSFPPNVFNYAPQQLKKWRAALASVKTGVANARILCIGDSTTFGAYSNGTGSGAWNALNYPAQLAARFNSAGINAHSNSWMGAGRTITDQLPFDSRMTTTSDWTVFTPQGIGGFIPCSQSVTGTGYLSFTPTVNVSTFNIFYVQTTTARSFNWNINGGSNTNVSTLNATTGLAVATATGTLGANTLNIQYSSGSNYIYINGIEAYDNSKKWVSVINAGWRGSTASSWNQSASLYNPIPAISVVAPNLTLINLSINDWNAGTAISTYIANIQAVITAALATGDVILVTANPSQTPFSGDATQSAQQQYVTALYGLAASNNLVLIDLFSRWGTWTSSNSLGMNYDNLHPNQLGYNDMAQFIANVIVSP